MNVLTLLQQRLQAALEGLVEDPTPFAAMVKPAGDARFGDYQANCAMSLAKQLKRKPPEVARAIVDRLDLGDLLQPPEVAGPGFINLRLRDDWLAARMRQMAADERLGIEPATAKKTFVIDYSSPNVAKPLHVGHLRSTIIGDALARLLRFLGHHVVTDNHLGDWGLQFGMLLYGYKHHRDEEALRADPVQEMVRLYLVVRQLIEPAEKVEDKPEAAGNYRPEELARSQEVLRAARHETSKLHAGDRENRALWRQFMPWCLAEIEPMYRRLDVHFDQTLGESFYNPLLPGVVEALLGRGVAGESQGAAVIFFEPDNPGEDPPAAIVRSSHGAFTYTTTDLATIKYRLDTWKPDAILYVVDVRQGLHFRHLFEAARRWGCATVELQHISFGAMLGRDRKPIKTREGGSTPLSELLDEAVCQAARVYEANRAERLARGEEVPELSEAERRAVHEVVGVGAVKYADLSQNRTSDYVFDLDKMTATDGNTATYMQYAYARVCGILRKGGVHVDSLRKQPPPVVFERPEERALALQLLRFGEALGAAAADYRPNLITAYLWDLAKTFSGFYQNCPVLKPPTPELGQSRLLLCDLTARVIQRGLDLLGIRTVERM
jgi:arginyl-tRNA synthetase